MITLGYVPFSFKVYLFCLWFKVRTLIYCQGSISTNASYRNALVLIQPTRNGHVDNCCNLKRKCFIIHNVFHRMKSHLSVDWMVTEWWLIGHWMVTGKVDFSRISVTMQLPCSRLNGRHISVTIQSAYFLKNKIAPDANRTRDVRMKGKAR